MNQPTVLEKPPADLWLKLVQYRVQGISYGTVQIVIHNSQVVEIDATEKIRVDLHQVAPTFHQTV
jgi:hypothetical protein